MTMAELNAQPFGVTAEGRNVEQWTLRSGEYCVQVLTYGGTLRSYIVPAPEGRRDIVLGCDSLAQYEAQDKYFGGLVGRVANRIGGACFDLGGRRYVLAANSGLNCLHGGIRGFHRAVWAAREEKGTLVLTYISPEGEEGFPGELKVQVTYSLAPDGALTLNYWAQSSADTLCSLTNHSYFNLMGHAWGSLEGQKIQILSDAITEIDENGIPTGRLLPVKNTPFNLRAPRDFFQGLGLWHPQMELGKGYDHNFVLNRERVSPLRPAARVFGGELCLECFTTQPGLQLYTANFLSGDPGKGGTTYGPRCAFCLETQAWPDAVHHPGFPSVLLPGGEVYRQTTTYRAAPVGRKGKL